ncbi:MAG: hypothetical protein PHO81_05890 [Candidatus Omnitrophica bacterium]|nr:hypothetical protein [Candidatus Omnitrophota bacterium]
MKRNICFILTTAFYILSTVLLGCATVKEMGKGFAGISTKVLEDTRKDALKRSFPLDYDSSYAEVKKILLGKKEEKEPGQEGTGAYIYAEDPAKKMIAVYVSEADTTPVGIFFTVERKKKTLIEISSPSVYAKEYIAKNIFTGIDELLKPAQEETKPDVKEEPSNQ